MKITNLDNKILKLPVFNHNLTFNSMFFKNILKIKQMCLIYFKINSFQFFLNTIETIK